MTEPAAKSSTVVPGHGLQREGAAFDRNGGPLPVSIREGRAKCACGALSGVLPTKAARRRWHNQHKKAYQEHRLTAAQLPQHLDPDPPVLLNRAPTRESRIEQHLLSACRDNRFQCLKFTSPARSGVPDRIIVTEAVTVFLELKRPGETPSELQTETHQRMRRFGAHVFTAASIEEVDELIDQLVAFQRYAPDITKITDML